MSFEWDSGRCNEWNTKEPSHNQSTLITDQLIYCSIINRYEVYHTPSFHYFCNSFIFRCWLNYSLCKLIRFLCYAWPWKCNYVLSLFRSFSFNLLKRLFSLEYNFHQEWIQVSTRHDRLILVKHFCGWLY